MHSFRAMTMYISMYRASTVVVSAAASESIFSAWDTIGVDHRMLLPQSSTLYIYTRINSRLNQNLKFNLFQFIPHTTQ